MDANRKNPREVKHYEGLVRKTAAELVPRVEEDFDDICQFLRMKVWKAIDAFNPARVKTTSRFSPDQQLERFVYSCVKNATIDVLKKKRRNLIFIEDIVRTAEHERPDGEWEKRDGFEKRYLSVDNAYATVEEGTLPFVPSTLTDTERRVLFLLVLDYKPAEIAVEVGVRHKDVWALTKEIREKMADWKPSAGAPEAAGAPAL